MTDYLSDRNLQTKKKAFWSVLKFPVYAGFGFTGVFLLYRAYGLYQTAFQKWGLSTVGTVCGTQNHIPFVGDFIAGGCHGLAELIIGAIALVVLIALTIVESIPTLVYFHVPAIEGMILQLRDNVASYVPIGGEQGDTPEVEALITRHKRISETGLKTLLIFSIAAFVAEALIVWVARGQNAPLMSVLIDSLAFEALLAGLLAFRNAFRSKPQRAYRNYQEF